MDRNLKFCKKKCRYFKHKPYTKNKYRCTINDDKKIKGFKPKWINASIEKYGDYECNEWDWTPVPLNLNCPCIAYNKKIERLEKI